MKRGFGKHSPSHIVADLKACRRISARKKPMIFRGRRAGLSFVIFGSCAAIFALTAMSFSGGDSGVGIKSVAKSALSATTDDRVDKKILGVDSQKGKMKARPSQDQVVQDARAFITEGQVGNALVALVVFLQGSGQIERFAQKNSPQDVIWNEANYWYSSGDLFLAEKLLREWLRIEGGRTNARQRDEVRFQLGQLHLAAGDTAGALELYNNMANTGAHPWNECAQREIPVILLKRRKFADVEVEISRQERDAQIDGGAKARIAFDRILLRMSQGVSSAEARRLLHDYSRSHDSPLSRHVQKISRKIESDLAPISMMQLRNSFEEALQVTVIVPGTQVLSNLPRCLSSGLIVAYCIELGRSISSIDQHKQNN